MVLSLLIPLTLLALDISNYDLVSITNTSSLNPNVSLSLLNQTVLLLLLLGTFTLSVLIPHTTIRYKSFPCSISTRIILSFPICKYYKLSLTQSLSSLSITLLLSQRGCNRIKKGVDRGCWDWRKVSKTSRNRRFKSGGWIWCHPNEWKN